MRDNVVGSYSGGICATTENRATLTGHHRPRNTSSQLLVTKCTSQSMWQCLHGQKLSATPASHRHSCLTVHSSVSGSQQTSHKCLLIPVLLKKLWLTNQLASHERKMKLRCKSCSRLTNALVCPAETASWRLSILCLDDMSRSPKLHVAPAHAICSDCF